MQGHEVAHTRTSLHTHPYPEMQHATPIKTLPNQPSMPSIYESCKPKLHRRKLKQKNRYKNNNGKR